MRRTIRYFGSDHFTCETLEHLCGARRPPDRHAPGRLITETKVQAAIVLAAETHSPVDHLALGHTTELHRHLGADGAAIAARADQLELDPVACMRSVAIQQRPSLI